MLHHIGLQVIAHRIGIPLHPAEEVLHPIWGRIAHRFRQLPAVLALHWGQQTTQVSPRPPPRLGPSKPRRDPVHNAIQAVAQSCTSACVTMLNYLLTEVTLK